MSVDYDTQLLYKFPTFVAPSQVEQAYVLMMFGVSSLGAKQNHECCN